MNISEQKARKEIKSVISKKQTQLLKKNSNERKVMY